MGGMSIANCNFLSFPIITPGYITSVYLFLQWILCVFTSVLNFFHFSNVFSLPILSKLVDINMKVQVLGIIVTF